MVGWEQVLGEEGIRNVASYVAQLGESNTAANPGETQFDQFCSTCHGSSGEDNPLLGAPSLVDASGHAPPVGNTVDLDNATYTNSIGDSELRGLWQDPDFKPHLPAVYYVRVLQIPTPRWTLYDKVRFDLQDLPANTPLITQERAYTSAIWYQPSK